MKINLYPHLYLSVIRLFFFLIILTGSSRLCAQIPDSTIFRDDFDQNTLGTFWQAHDSWSIVNGTAYNFIDGVFGTLKTTTAYSQSSYIIETAARGFTNNYYREFRITFGQADLANESLYQLRYTAYGTGPRVTLYRSIGNLYPDEVLNEEALFEELNSTQWYTFKIARYKSGLIQVYIDKGSGYDTIPLLEAIDSTYNTLAHTGWRVGSETFAEEFYVDWFSASKPGVEKPAIREKPVEDDLISQVSVKSGKPYTVAKLNPGVKQLIDRDYTITAVPGYLKGASFIQTANEDKANKTENLLSFFLKEDAIVYIAYDPRGTVLPEWLIQHWTSTGDSIFTSDENAPYLHVYSRIIQSEERFFPVILGGNLANPALGAQTNYLVAAVKRPAQILLQAEDALLSGAVVASNHLNYMGAGFVDFKNSSNDFIEWTVPVNIPGIYNLGFTFAHAGSANRSLQITDNRISLAIVDFSNISSSWSSWAFLNGPDLFLSAGVHKIRLSATGTSGPNIDQLSVTYLYPSTPKIFALAKNYPPQNAVSDNASLAYKVYPNPFSQSTTINYTLKDKAKVNLSIYSVHGQQIQLLQNGMREPGNYQATFNAGKLAKGVYFYKLQIGKDIKTGKLLKD